MNDIPDFRSLDIIAEFTQESIAVQMEQVNALDSKANFVLGSATALVSAALVLQAVLLSTRSTTSSMQSASILTPTSQTPTSGLTTNGTVISSYFSLSTHSWAYVLPVVGLILVYFVVMLFAFSAYRVREYQRAPNPNELYDTYLHRDEKDTKAEIFRATLEAYNDNVLIINKKVHRLKWAFRLMGFETVILVFVLIIQIFN